MQGYLEDYIATTHIIGKDLHDFPSGEVLAQYTSAEYG